MCKCGHLDFVGSNKGYLVALRHCKWLNHIFNGCTCFFALNFVNDLSIRGILHPIICKEFARHSFIKHEKSAASYVIYVNFGTLDTSVFQTLWSVSLLWTSLEGKMKVCLKTGMKNWRQEMTVSKDERVYYNVNRKQHNIRM